MHFLITVFRRTSTLLALAAAVALSAITCSRRRPIRRGRSRSSFRSAPAGRPMSYVRALALELQKSLHQTFVIENRPGAGTTIGTDFVAKATPDGYTLLMASSTQTVNETLYKHKPYRAVARPRPDRADGRERSGTGRESIGAGQKRCRTVGLGKSQAGDAQFRFVRTGLELSHGRRAFEEPHRHRHRARAVQRFDRHAHRYPQRPDPNAVRFDSDHGALCQSRQSARAGHHAVLPVRPSCPTCRQLPKPVPGFEFSQWVGFMAPKGTPQPIIDLLHHTITGILSRPDIKQDWESKAPRRW